MADSNKKNNKEMYLIMLSKICDTLYEARKLFLDSYDNQVFAYDTDKIIRITQILEVDAPVLVMEALRLILKEESLSRVSQIKEHARFLQIASGIFLTLSKDSEFSTNNKSELGLCCDNLTILGLQLMQTHMLMIDAERRKNILQQAMEVAWQMLPSAADWPDNQPYTINITRTPNGFEQADPSIKGSNTFCLQYNKQFVDGICVGWEYQKTR